MDAYDKKKQEEHAKKFEEAVHKVWEDSMEFKIRELNEDEIHAVGHMLEEALDCRIELYIQKFGAEGAEQFIIENTKSMPVVREMYLTRYRVIIHARLGG